MKNKIYWYFRRIIQTGVFGFKRLCNNIFVFFNTRQPLVRVQKVLFIEVCKQVLFNIAICFLLFKADLIIGSKFLMKIVEKPFEINGDLVSDMLIGMIGIAGVLLGLYCSYIVSVFSAKYADAPKQISSLFENDMITATIYQNAFIQGSAAANALYDFFIFGDTPPDVILISPTIFTKEGLMPDYRTDIHTYLG